MVQHPIVFMFSGQGSQYHGMGGELFKKNETFTECMERLDEVCMRSLGRSIIEVLYSPGKSGAETFNDLRLTSPAIFMVEYSLACSLLANRVYPSYVLGSSLGMFAAAAIAGCLTPEEAMRVIIAETELIEETCPQGTMIAVLGSTDVIRRNNLLFETCEIAAVNFASGFVISALKSNLGAIVEELTSEGVAFHVLDVTRPFHSRWIDPARHECLALLQTVNFTKPSVPIVCCAHRGTIKDLTPDFLWAVIRGTI